MEPTSLLIQNLIDAFAQLNQYFGLGLVTAVSALALDTVSKSSTENEKFTPSGFVPMSRENAQLVFVGISFVAGLMGSYAAESSAGIVDKLSGSPELLAAACTYSSVATAPVGVPVIAAILPILFVAPVFWRKWKKIREGGILGMFAVYAGAYILLGITLANMPCRAS